MYARLISMKCIKIEMIKDKLMPTFCQSATMTMPFQRLPSVAVDGAFELI